MRAFSHAGIWDNLSFAGLLTADGSTRFELELDCPAKSRLSVDLARIGRCAPNPVAAAVRSGAKPSRGRKPAGHSDVYSCEQAVSRKIVRDGFDLLRN